MGDSALEEILRSNSSAERIDETVLSDGENNRPVFPSSSPGSDSLPSRLSASSSGSTRGTVPSPPRRLPPMVGCPEHPGGKPQGKDCPNCDLILNSQLAGGNSQLNLMQSRNSCKTLKCPKCNWHYKYQETLEIHMKEKHPDHETTCMYCIMNQPHPRLSRGESYTCGYKPYRCDVCNYSTTTKGNLSIHMQSDKHLNNMQELQQSGSAPPVAEMQQQPNPRPSPPPPQQPMLSPKASQRPKSTWRCDVCNYETNVARNLRIHMTSEKHTHNLILLQQNVKQMQHLSTLQQHPQHQVPQNFDPASLLLQMVPGMNNPGGSGSHGAQGEGGKPAEAALADMAYSQALLLQLMASGQLPAMNAGPGQLEGDPGPQMPDVLDQGDPVDPNPTNLFQCCICAVCSTDSLDSLNRHLSCDRNKPEPDVLMVVVGNYICKLCSYKTNLKANFQLHCKTDKHLQKLQHVNHIREGGPKNEWRLKFLSVNQPVQVRCNACDFYANSTHKLGLHTQAPQHNIGTVLWWHLKQAEEQVPSVQSRLYSCSLCNFSSTAKMNLIRHVRSIRHLQMEQLYQMRRRQEGIESPADISLIFLVTDSSETASENGNMREYTGPLFL
jgi:AT-binding transcription factor 1